MVSVSVCCTWSRRPAVWCAPVWKHVAPPRPFCPCCCWSAAPDDAPETRCTAHKGSGGSTFPPPEQRQKTYRTLSKTKTSMQLIKKQHLHTPLLKSFGHSLASGCMFPKGFVASSTSGSFALYLEGAIWQIKNILFFVIDLLRFQFKGFYNSLWCNKK